MPEPGASVFVSIFKTANGTGSLRQFVSKDTRLKLPSGLLALDNPPSHQAPQVHIRPIMGIWETIKAALGRGTSAPPDARRLRAVDELALSASIRALPVGERGWITLSEARALFSQMNAQYAFGEMDEEGKLRLAEFAAGREHRSIPEFMPVEGRVYFTRKAT